MTDRAVSVTVGYALNLTIATLLLSGLFIASGSLVQSEQERVINNELEVIGQQIAADLMTADRLIEAGDEDRTDANGEIGVSLPNQVAGSSYTLEINDDENELVLESTQPSVEVTVPFVIDTDLGTESFTGGDLTIEWYWEEDDGNEIVVTSA